MSVHDPKLFAKAVAAAMTSNPDRRPNMYYEEMDAKMRQVSGFSINQVISLFAAGYVLKPPKAQPEFKEPVIREIS